SARPRPRRALASIDLAAAGTGGGAGGPDRWAGASAGGVPPAELSVARADPRPAAGRSSHPQRPPALPGPRRGGWPLDLRTAAVDRPAGAGHPARHPGGDETPEHGGLEGGGGAGGGAVRGARSGGAAGDPEAAGVRSGDPAADGAGGAVGARHRPALA